MVQMVKNLPAIQGTRVPSLGGEEPLEEGMATHSSIPAWKNPQRSLAGYCLWGCKELDMTERLTFSLSITFLKALSPVTVTLEIRFQPQFG